MTFTTQTPSNRTRAAGILSVFTAAVFGTAAVAQTDALDTDGDGMVSYTELLVAVPDITEDDFGTLDTNGDGMLDADELASAQASGLISLG